jgi:uncharacterized protein YcnI
VSKQRRPGRILAVGAATFLALAPMAAAHVTVDPGEATKGGYAALAFRVPNERDDAGTTSLEVTIPEETPISSVRVRPTPGWTHEVEIRQLDEPLEVHGREVTEVVGKITWTGGTINPGEYEEFNVSAGPLPEDVDEIVFPSIQTYEGGEVVRWIEEGEDVERPAPVLTLVDAEDEAGSGDSDEGEGDEGGAAADGEAAGVSVSNTASQDDVDSATTLATVGIVVGVLGLLAGGVAILRSRKAGDTRRNSATGGNTP